MSQQQFIEFLDNQPGRQPGGLNKLEIWWVERQEALEAVGYMLWPRYRPGWIPSWHSTNKFYLKVEDGPSVSVSTYFTYMVCPHEVS
jgi:hypothetical protein